MGRILFHLHILEHVIQNYGHWTHLKLMEPLEGVQDDLVNEDSDVVAVALDQNTQNMDRLTALRNVKTLYIKNPSSDQIEIIAKCSNLKCLVLSESRSRNIKQYEDLFKRLPDLEELILDRFTPISSLAPLKHLPNLRCLCLKSMRKIKSIDGLQHCSELRYFSFETWWEEFLFKLNDLDALNNLNKLEVLSLAPLHRIITPPKVRKWSFLENLKFISLPDASFEVEDLAYLKKYHPNIEGAPIYPYRVLVDKTIDDEPSQEDQRLPYSEFAIKYPLHHMDGVKRVPHGPEDIRIFCVRFLEVGRKSIATVTNYTTEKDVLQIKIKEAMSDALDALNEAMDRV